MSYSCNSAFMFFGKYPYLNNFSKMFMPYISSHNNSPLIVNQESSSLDSFQSVDSPGYYGSVFGFGMQNPYDVPFYRDPSFLIFDNDLGARSTSLSKKRNKTYDNTKRAVKTSNWNNFSKKNGVKKITIAGSEVYACRWSNFSNSQPEWLEMQKYMIEAAEELGYTLVYSDMDRTVAASNAGRAKKGDIVVKGGQSPHNYGVATDICLFKNGKMLSSKSADFAKFAELVKEKSNNRIAWGGDWTKQNEEHHFELRGWRDKYKNADCLIA